MTVVQHVAFNCADRAASEAFYARFFGFQRARVFRAGQADEFVMLRLGGTCLELFGAAPNAPRADADAVGFKHLAFEVPDIEAKIRELQAGSVAVGDIIDCSALVPHMRVCFFEDPDGNVLEIMERWSDDPNLARA